MPSDSQTVELIEKRIQELPPRLRDAILSPELTTHIQKVAAANQLHIDQAGALEEQTLLVMLGFTAPEAFANQLQTALALTPEKTAALAASVNTDILEPLRDTMKPYKSSAADVPVAPATQRMLTEPTVATVPAVAEPPQMPVAYKADPYREPIE